MQLVPALCLDLDGTVRYSTSGKFINKPSDIALFPGVEEVLWQYRDNGHLILGITNQGGVAHGLKSPTDEAVELSAMFSLFERNPFHLVKSCYHMEGGKVFPFNVRSLLRKPDIGMLALCEYEAFLKGWVIDWNQSMFVGDRLEDQKCAANAGIAFRWAWEFFGREVPNSEKS